MALQKITIGFTGTQVLGVRIDKDALTTLLDAVESGGWHDLPIDDGEIRLNLDQVVYVRTEHEEQRVGFGLSS